MQRWGEAASCTSRYYLCLHMYFFPCQNHILQSLLVSAGEPPHCISVDVGRAFSAGPHDLVPQPLLCMEHILHPTDVPLCAGTTLCGPSFNNIALRMSRSRLHRRRHFFLTPPPALRRTLSRRRTLTRKSRQSAFFAQLLQRVEPR